MMYVGTASPLPTAAFERHPLGGPVVLMLGHLFRSEWASEAVCKRNKEIE